MHEEKDSQAEDSDVGNKPRSVSIPYPILVLLVLGVLGQQQLFPVALGL